jgi:hypothetical protein
MKTLFQYPEGHVSRSIYVAFKMTHLGDSFPKELEALLPELGVAIWTTTPWTIPGNAGKLSLERVCEAEKACRFCGSISLNILANRYIL